MASVEAARERIVTMLSEIEQAKARLDALYDERRDLFRVCLDAGDKQAALARLAQVTPMAVAYALESKINRGRRSAWPQPRENDGYSIEHLRVGHDRSRPRVGLA